MPHRFTDHVVQQGLLKSDPFRLIDIGARGEPPEVFKPLEGSMETIGFEMDAAESARLNEAYKGKGYRCLPYVLGEKAEEKTFYVTNWPPSCGLYKNRIDYWSRYTPWHLKNLTVLKEVQVTTQGLDACLEREGIDSFDFLKIDVEGAEVDVLRGGASALRKCLGAQIETRFQNVNNCPLFADTDVFMRQHGFRLHDFLHIGKYPRKTLPDPRCWAGGKEVHWQEDSGQVMWGETLYFTDPIDGHDIVAKAGLDQPLKLIKFIIVVELYGYLDYAIELVNAYPDVIAKVMPVTVARDLLTPTVNGTVVSYARYVDAAKKGKDVMEREIPPPRPPSVLDTLKSKLGGLFR
ncbi:MAG: FkbM family methyltransferase [Alphaproteobacteria bacterium]|nr:FkbM family methyltransferase [Alphaproteobacteria bacterium]